MEINDYLPTTEILAQLGEEAAELGQAALKLRRVLDGSNPTPVALPEAWANLREEYGDVLNCIELLFDGPIDFELCVVGRERKMERWKKRLEEARNKRKGAAGDED